MIYRIHMYIALFSMVFYKYMYITFDHRNASWPFVQFKPKVVTTSWPKPLKVSILHLGKVRHMWGEFSAQKNPLVLAGFELGLFMLASYKK